MNQQTFGERLAECKEDELGSMKIWLFRENVRLEAEKANLEMAQRDLERERTRLEQKEEVINQELEILKKGFANLEKDRREYARNVSRQPAMENDAVQMLFRGVNSYMTLKKRYKDLMKMFHPDSIAGDNDMVRLVNRVYEQRKREYEEEMRA